ncbi:MAG TPA: rhomboid family intramembrane serine protease [Dehalococcoidales bacterium]|nr:rhomboid family intramembrane serine protease [Dehalococcoidales bacterium]
MHYKSRGTGINPIWIILAVNLMIFLATLIDENVIYARFGLQSAGLDREPWTLFTYMFVHAGLFHILPNMFTLYFFGTFAKALVGETAFLITYFAGGIMGGLFFYFFSMLLGNPYTILVGASGAVYALGGLLLVMRPNARVVAFPIPVPMPLWVAILVGFLIVSFIPGVSWQAHLGGIVLGAAVGYYFRRREYRRF